MRRRPPPDRPEHGGIRDVLHGLDEDRKVVALGHEIQLFDRTPVHEQAPRFGRVGGAAVEVHAFELPARLAELSEQVEVEPVTTADVQDGRVRGQGSARREQAAGLEPPAPGRRTRSCLR